MHTRIQNYAETLERESTSYSIYNSRNMCLPVRGHVHTHTHTEKLIHERAVVLVGSHKPELYL